MITRKSSLQGITFIAALAISFLSLPASADEETTDNDKNERVCFYASAVNKFEPIDEYHLMVTANGSKKYLLTLSQRCYDLKSTPQIVFDTHASRVCSDTRTRLITTRDRCTISEVEKVSSWAEAKKLAEEDQETWKSNRDKRDGNDAESED